MAITGSDNGLSPGRRQAIIWTNAGILLIGPLGIHFSEILIEICAFSFMKMLLKNVVREMSAIFLSVLNVLTPLLLESEYSCRTRPISLLLIPGFLAFLMLAQNYATCRGFTLFCAKTGCTSSNWCLVDGLMQKRCNTSALVMELYLYYINASILWPTMMHHLTPCVTVFHACETMGGY